MKTLLTSILFALVIIIPFLILKIYFSLWSSISISLIFSLILFGLYSHKLCKESEIIKLSIGTGTLFIIFSWVGIKLFPPTKIRDLGDIIMPYFNSFFTGLIIIAFFLLVGIIIKKRSES
ncbi:MAG TPA: hypothetical protein DDY49_14830 [Paenibacillaceae bacterium]|nr:hypothetical protein [Paenibacillaceae bacterium]